MDTSRIIRLAIIDDGIRDEAIPVHDRVIINDETIDTTINNGVGKTHADICASIILAVYSNVELVDIKIIGKNGCGNVSDAVHALDWCKDNCIDVINMSLGVMDIRMGRRLSAAVDRLVKRDVIIVSSYNNMNIPTWPASNKNVYGVITYENDTIDFNGLSDLYQNVKEKSETTLYPLDYGSYEPLQMFDNTYFMENDCFDSAEYTDYVQKNRQMDYSNDYRVRQFYIGGGADPDVLGIQVVIEPTYTDIVENLFHTGDGLSEPVLYKGLHGESFIEPFKAAAISEKSQNKELAWDFLKFTISERYFDINDVGSISVNRKKARETLSGVDAEIIDRIIDDIDQVDTIPYNSAEWRNSVKLLYDQYYIEKSIDADQMAKMMQDRLFLYKNE